IPAGFALSHGNASSHAHSVLPSAEVVALCGICFPYAVIAGSISRATFFQAHWPRTPTHAALAGTVLQSSLNSLNVRKLPLAVRERGSPEGEGTREHDIWHRLCVCHMSQQLYWLLRRRNWYVKTM